jgi:hypothetical protein
MARVFIDMMPADNLQSATDAAARVRLTAFHDHDHALGLSMARTLGWKGHVAWDIYFVYREGTLWTSEVAKRAMRRDRRPGVRLLDIPTQRDAFVGDEVAEFPDRSYAFLVKLLKNGGPFSADMFATCNALALHECQCVSRRFPLIASTTAFRSLATIIEVSERASLQPP